jgi:hypothetical protein
MPSDGELPGATFDPRPMFMAHVGRFTIGFVTTGDNQSPASLGSGTLIRFGKVGGVLTCAHVIQELEKQDEIGLMGMPVRADQVQRLRVERRLTDFLSLSDQPWSECGKDIGFVKLPDPTMAAIERVASVLDGETQLNRALESVADDVREIAVLAGILDERTAPPVLVGEVITTAFNATLTPGILHQMVEFDGMDRVRLQPVYGTGAVRATCFKGTSGGGLWKVLVSRSDNSFIQSRLFGIAYYEREIESELQVICHGPRSIYSRLLREIDRKWGPLNLRMTSHSH